MNTENTLGYTIEVRGTDEAISAQNALRVQLIGLTDEIKKHKDATSDDVDKQKNFADVLVRLETQQKAVRQELNNVTKEILNQSAATGNAQGSINDLTSRLGILSSRYKEMSGAHRENSATGKLVSAEMDAIRSKLNPLDTSVTQHSRNIFQLANGMKGLSAIGIALADVFGADASVVHELTRVHGEFRHGVMGSKEVMHGFGDATKEASGAMEEQAATGVAAIPVLGAIVLAVAAVGAVIWRYREQLFGLTDAQKEKIKADDGELISNDKLRESYNENIKKIRDLEVEYRVLTGELSKEQGEMVKLENKNKDALDKINKETKKQLEETGGWWGGLEIAIAQSFGLGMLEVQKQADELNKIENDNAKATIEQNKVLEAEKRVQKAKDDEQFYKTVNEAMAEQNKLDKETVKKKQQEEKKDHEKEIQELEKYFHERYQVILQQTTNELNLQRQKLKAAFDTQTKAERDEVNQLEKNEDEINKFLQTKSAGKFTAELKMNEWEKNQMLARVNSNKAFLEKERADVFANDKLTLDEKLKQSAKIIAQEKKTDEQITAITKEAADRDLAIKAKMADTELGIAASGFKALSGLFKQNSIEQKAFALAAIAADEAKAIAHAIESAAANPFNAATFGGAMAAQLAIELPAILAGFAEAQKIFSTPIALARGGMIDGPGTETSDSIPIRASRNESVINARSTQMFKPLLSAINQAGGGRAFAEGGIPLPSGISNPLAALGGGGINIDELALKLGATVNNKKVYIVEKEMADAHQKAAIKENASRF